MKHRIAAAMLTVLLLGLLCGCGGTELLPAEEGAWETQYLILCRQLPADARVSREDLLVEHVRGETYQLYLPYEVDSIQHVGLAGTSNWYVRMGVLAAEEKNGQLTVQKAPRLRDVSLEVTAGENTGLRYEEDYVNPLTITMTRKDRLDTGEYAVSFHAATRDSALAVNEPCEAVFRWQFTLPGGEAWTMEKTVGYLSNAR